MRSEELIRFGVFEVNPRTAEVRKNGMRVKLAGQPVQILNILLEHPGEVVTREELQRRLWPADTFVEFEHSLNTAVKKLRQALGDTAEHPHYVETLPRVGYRFIAPVQNQTSSAATVQRLAEKTPLVTPHTGMLPGSERWLRWRWALLLGVGIGLFAALAGYWQWSRSRARPQPSGARTMLAVLPFENLTGDAGQEYFSDGLTEEMISQLGSLDPQHLAVIARTSVMHYKHSGAQLDQIGRELGVQYALEGSVRRDADRVRISAQLIRLQDQTHLWARQYDRELSSLLALQAEIAQEIADEIQVSLGGADRLFASDRKPAAHPSSYEAYDLYLKGRYFWNKRTEEGFQQAAEYFQRSIAKDPNYARAYAGLADTFGLMSTWLMVPQNEFMPKARAAALKALQIDDTLAEAHASLALIVEIYDYDWQTAEKEFGRAIQLDPGYPTAHQWYAEYLSWQGRFEEALAESDRARQLDPLSAIIATDHAAIFYFSRHYDRAIAQARTALDMDPSSVRARGFLLRAYVREGRFAEALDYIERQKLRPDDPWAWAEKAEVYGSWGRTAQAQQALATTEQLLPRWPLENTVLLVPVYAAVGRKDQAIALLQTAYAQHWSVVCDIKVEPEYDPLRSDPRFQDLLRRVGLAQ